MGLGKAKLSMSKLTQENWELPDLPTWIVLGRSNVGKSSLLNALIHPQDIFRSGSTPGVTRGLVGATVEMGRKEFFILDLPGWGFAVKSQIDQGSWQELGEKLREKMRENKTQFIWLVDPRREFDQDSIAILNWLGPMNWFLLFTKSDQVKRSQRNKVETEWGLALKGSTEAPLWVSAMDGEGISVLAGRARSFVKLILEGNS